MQIDLGIARVPYMKLRETPGQTFTGYVCHLLVRPHMNPGTNTQSVTKDGKLRDELRVHFIVKETTGVVKDGEGTRPVEPGEEAYVVFDGHRWGAWIKAYKKLGMEKTGDVVHVVYTGDERGEGTILMKVWSVQVRRPIDKEAAMVAACAGVYHRVTSAAPSQVALGAVGESDYDDDFDPTPGMADETPW